MNSSRQSSAIHPHGRLNFNLNRVRCYPVLLAKVKKPILLALIVLMTQGVHAKPDVPCASNTRMHAEKLLRLFFGGDDDRMGIADEVKLLKPIKNPTGKGFLDVEEVWGGVYKGSYRMRFIYRNEGKGCILVGQEIFHDAEL